ncbi:cytochrome c oxidase subunit 3 [Alteribacillus sp. YIM 98480]|uniref:cytochrome c oxidase subunit 3 n=1 Tax=Alteribacillus sp. YIM 98480 TaxID=2606599 RepID=UPI00131BD3F6|nr:cytochrome c oxidase subunit 3 [Alteribacillus sp. YIM 98480]
MAEQKSASQIKSWTEPDDRLGMWLFIAAESVVFLCLIATFLVSSKSTLNGPDAAELLELPPILIPSFLLLSSSWTFHLAEKRMEHRNISNTMLWLSITLSFALVFLGFEIYEFFEYAKEGYTLSESPFLASFYVLVGTHGAHVLFGSVWMGLLLWHLYTKRTIWTNWKRIRAFGLYWHFVDVVWVFIFTLVYILGSQGVY